MKSRGIIGGISVRCVGINDDSVSFIVGGEAGQGITRSGSLLGKALMRGGFHIFGSNDYPSVIKGGHNFFILRASSNSVHSQVETIDLLVALNKETVIIHEHELNEGGAIIHDDRTEFSEMELKRSDVVLYPIPMSGIVEELGGPAIMRNTVALGATLALVGFNIEIMKEVISDTFTGAKR